MTLPIGPVVDPLPSGQPPARKVFEGATVRLEPLDPTRHGDALYRSAHGNAARDSLWTYMGSGPFADESDFRGWIERCSPSEDPLFFAVVDARSDEAVGMVSYLNIVPAMGTIEVGHIWYAPAVQRTRLPTEAMYLMFRHVFDDLGYRRLEWKCNALNAKSRAAALRLGFTFEGIFRQHMIVKGRNRDTAWFSMLDREWPAVRANMERWLAPENFDAEGRQRVSLSALNRERAPVPG